MTIRDVSADLGNGFCKVRSSTKQVSFPSVISVEDETARGFAAAGLSANNDFVIEFNGRRWAIGETVRTHGLMPVTITHRSRITTEYYKVLFAAALAEAVGQSATVRAMLSLPPAAYYDKEAQKDALAGVYAVGLGGRTLTYTVPRELLRVIPEGFGAATLLCLGKDGAVHDSALFNSRVGIIDVGTYTTDFVRLDNLKLNRSGTDSIPHALSDIHTRARDHMSSQGVDIDVHEADDVLRAGYFLRGGRRVPISAQRDIWSRDLAQVVAGQVRSLWGGGDAVEHILVAGGGEPYVAPYLAEEFPHARPVKAPGVAPWEYNVEGAYRYTLLLNAMGE